MSAVAAATRSSGTVARERLRLDDDQAHVVRDDVVELLGDPHALLGDRALGEQLALAVEALGALLERLEARAAAAHEQARCRRLTAHVRPTAIRSS